MEQSVREIIKDAVKEYNYVTIILFGSRARNNYRVDSDYDILLIVTNDNTIESLRYIQREIRKKLALNEIDADIIVKTQDMVDKYKKVSGNVIYEAIREGVVL